MKQVNLTEIEAQALLHALGNSTDHPDVMESLFCSEAEKEAAYRAQNKLCDAFGLEHLKSTRG